MTDTDNRLKQIEQKLDALSRNYQPSPNNDENNTNDEIDLRELWTVIWAGKFKIMAITAVFAIASAIYALSLPNMYKSTMVLAPAQTDNKGGMGALAAQYGGLAAMAGIDLSGNDSSRIEQAITLMKSWPFLEVFVNKYNLKPQVMAVKSWNIKTKELIYDYDIYNPKTKKWTKKVDLEEGESPEPTSWETYEVLMELLHISIDENTGMLQVEVVHYSPHIAYKWVNLLKQEINSFYQQQDMMESQKNIEYLATKIAETKVTEMQSVFYNMIESQTKTLMLAEVSDQYLVKTIVPAKVAEEKSRPKRALICLLGIVLGSMFSVMFFLIRHYMNSQKKP